MFFEDESLLLEVYSNTSFIDADEISLFLLKTSELSTSSFLHKVKSFELSDDQIETFTGLSYEQLKVLKDMLVSMNNSKNRDT